MVQVYTDITTVVDTIKFMQYRVSNGSSSTENGDVYSGCGGNEALFNGMLPFNVKTTAEIQTQELTKYKWNYTSTKSGAHYNQYGGINREVWEIDLMQINFKN